MTEERRKQTRISVLKNAIIILPGKMTTLPCVVLDISGGGAKIRTDHWLYVPDSFGLKMDNGITHEAQVRHRDQDRVGLEFA